MGERRGAVAHLAGPAVTALPDAAFWRGRRVLVTGHTGFKGGWLALWLDRLGAEVAGYALAPGTRPSLFALSGLDRLPGHRVGDVRDGAALRRAVEDVRPEIVFHMAAQPLVRPSYADPVGTYETNVMGTVNLLDAARHVPEDAAVEIADTTFTTDADLQAAVETVEAKVTEASTPMQESIEAVEPAVRKAMAQIEECGTLMGS